MKGFSSSAADAKADARDQIAQLRKQVDYLMHDRVTPGLSDAAGRAQHVAQQASDMAHDQADALSGRVREQPLIALLVAVAVGYLVGRVVR